MPDKRPGPRIGDPAPIFDLPDKQGVQWSPIQFRIAGKPVLLVFETADSGAAVPILDDILSPAGPLAGMPLTVLHIGTDPAPADAQPDSHDFAYRRLTDEDGATYRNYRLARNGHDALVAVVLDSNCRVAGVFAVAPGEKPAVNIAACIESLGYGRARGHASAHAPVLVIPRLLDEAECRRCIDLWRHYDRIHDGAGHSHIEAESAAFLEEYGAMKQYLVEEPEHQAWLDEVVAPRITEEICKAFQTRATHREFYALLCYDSETQGHVLPHRDCASPETAHRRFTVSVMLNGDYQGGELRFREYSDELYQMPRGCAVVYSSALLHEVMPVTDGRRFALAFHLYGT